MIPNEENTDMFCGISCTRLTLVDLNGSLGVRAIWMGTWQAVALFIIRQCLSGHTLRRLFRTLGQTPEGFVSSSIGPMGSSLYRLSSDSRSVAAGLLGACMSVRP